MTVHNNRDWLAHLLAAGTSLPVDAVRDTPLVVVPVPRTQADGVRTDHAPLLRRLPALGDLTSARWVWARLGGDRVPGPATYAIDALCTLTRADADRLRATASAPVSFDLPAALGTVPRDLVGSDALDAALAHGGWRAQAGVSASEPVVVVRALGRD